MDYEKKYLKYKNKYLNLNNKIRYNTKTILANENINTGLKNIVNKKGCIKLSNKSMPLLETNTILDLDCMNISIEKKDFISKECIDNIRNNIQPFYYIFLNYVCCPNQEIHNNRRYNLAIIDMNNMGIVDYDMLYANIVKHENFLELCNLYTQLNVMINKMLIIVNNSLITKFKEKDINLLKIDVICMRAIEQYINTHGNVKSFDIIKEHLNHIYNIDITFEELYTKLANIFLNICTAFKHMQQEQMNSIYTKLANILLDIKKIIVKNNIYSFVFKIFNIYSIYYLQNIDKKYIENEKIYILKQINLLYKDEFVKAVLNKFIQNNASKQIIQIALIFISNLETFENNGHANSLVVYKYPNNTFLVIRTEPHRRSNVYCRNSIRKAIRDIFKSYDNFYFKDYVIKNNFKVGVQDGEAISDANELKNDTDYDNLEPKYQIVSPLQGNSGFCASWSMYTSMILLLNHDKNLEDIGLYLGTFYLDTDDTDNFDPLYTLYKHIKLYKAIILVLCFILNTLGETFLDRDILRNCTAEDKAQVFKILDECANQFSAFDEKLKQLNNKPIYKPSEEELSNYDPHYCTDNLFNHNEFCKPDNMSKVISIEDMKKYKCNSTNIELIGTNDATRQNKIDTNEMQSFLTNNNMYNKLYGSTTFEPTYIQSKL